MHDDSSITDHSIFEPQHVGKLGQTFRATGRQRAESRVPSFSLRCDTVYLKPCAENIRKVLTPTLPKDEKLEDRNEFLYDESNFSREYCDIWKFAMRPFWRMKSISKQSAVVVLSNSSPKIKPGINEI